MGIYLRKMGKQNESLNGIILQVSNFCDYQVARETNEELLAIKADPAEGFDVGAILSIVKRSDVYFL